MSVSPLIPDGILDSNNGSQTDRPNGRVRPPRIEKFTRIFRNRHGGLTILKAGREPAFQSYGVFRSCELALTSGRDFPWDFNIDVDPGSFSQFAYRSSGGVTRRYFGPAEPCSNFRRRPNIHVPAEML